MRLLRLSTVTSWRGASRPPVVEGQPGASHSSSRVREAEVVGVPLQAPAPENCHPEPCPSIQSSSGRGRLIRLTAANSFLKPGLSVFRGRSMEGWGRCFGCWVGCCTLFGIEAGRWKCSKIAHGGN